MLFFVIGLSYVFKSTGKAITAALRSATRQQRDGPLAAAAAAAAT